jgi:hypothetical protein
VEGGRGTLAPSSPPSLELHSLASDYYDGFKSSENFNNSLPPFVNVLCILMHVLNNDISSSSGSRCFKSGDFGTMWNPVIAYFNVPIRHSPGNSYMEYPPSWESSSPSGIQEIYHRFLQSVLSCPKGPAGVAILSQMIPVPIHIVFLQDLF